MRRQADPAQAVTHYFALALPGCGAGVLLPRDWTPRHRAFLLVADDGGNLSWPVSSRHHIRVTAFAADRQSARDTASAAQARLLAGRVPGVAFASRSAGVITDAHDPETGGWTASFTATVVARTEPKEH